MKSKRQLCEHHLVEYVERHGLDGGASECDPCDCEKCGEDADGNCGTCSGEGGRHLSGCPIGEESTECRECQSVLTWVPTYCNHPHCAECFAALDPAHGECAWNGLEHESYGPSETLPGKVHV